ncbi:MAG: phosphatase domain-containing protein [Vicinamibacterales bacterium]
MPDWRRDAHAFASAAERHLRRGLIRAERIVDRDPYIAVGYRGYGTRDGALVLGRVLQADEAMPEVTGGSRWRNLRAAITRLESDPMPHARVKVSVGGAVDDAREIVADDEGFFREWIGVREPLPEGGWVPVRLSIAGQMDRTLANPAESVSQVLVPPPGAAFGVISDMDDTVLQSNIASFLRAARLVLLENAQTRMPFHGVAAFYRALQAGTGLTGPNPIFYVSKSPWNLYDVIAQFLERQEIPMGPLLLRDWDLVPERWARPGKARPASGTERGLDAERVKRAGVRGGAPTNKAFKTREIEMIFQTYPSLPFILVGDTTQKDPEIYREIIRAFPGRVRAVYIRNVAATADRSTAVKKLAEEVSAESATLILADDTAAMAVHAAEQGWIDPASLPSIAGDMRADEGRTGQKQ